LRVTTSAADSALAMASASDGFVDANCTEKFNVFVVSLTGTHAPACVCPRVPGLHAVLTVANGIGAPDPTKPLSPIMDAHAMRPFLCTGPEETALALEMITNPETTQVDVQCSHVVRSAFLSMLSLDKDNKFIAVGDGQLADSDYYIIQSDHSDPTRNYIEALPSQSEKDKLDAIAMRIYTMKLEYG
jgi:hypothetical protein